MSRASVGGVAALVTTGVGVVLVVVAGSRMLRAGDPSAAGSPIARLDLTATAVALLGVAVVVGGVALALVALADRRLGRLEQDAPGPSEPGADGERADAARADAEPATTDRVAAAGPAVAPVRREPRTAPGRPRPTVALAPVLPLVPVPVPATTAGAIPSPVGAAEESPAVR